MLYEKRLKDLREKKEVSQKDVAAILSIVSGLYSQYETENTLMPIKHLNEVCNYFNVSLDYIFEFTNKLQYKNNLKNIDKKISGERLKILRKNSKLTQEKLANILNTSRTTITEYERGTNIIATPFLYSICKKYHISADYLLGKIEKPIHLK